MLKLDPVGIYSDKGRSNEIKMSDLNVNQLGLIQLGLIQKQ